MVHRSRPTATGPAEADREKDAVIAVTRLDGQQVFVNAELIESIEQTPDTIVSFTSGHKMLVRDSPVEIRRRVIEYKRASTGGATEPGEPDRP